MIKVTKRTKGPPILSSASSKGAALTAKLKLDYDNGSRDFEFKASVYGAKSVKRSLLAAQKRKCAFCESKFTHIAYGDVEHFRPKGGWAQREGEPLTKPGYYWLAYEWSNLFASCQICNQRFKKNLFPLSDPKARARTHHDDITLESSMLLNPSLDSPEDHIGFRGEIPYAKIGSGRGDATIRVLGLDREELNEVRRDRLIEAELLADSIDFLRIRIKSGRATAIEKDLLRDQELWLTRAKKTDAEYSSMLREMFRVKGLL